MNPNFISTFALSMRAKKVTFGYDTVKKAVLVGEIHLLLTASDLSTKTEKEVRFLAEKHGIPFLALPATMEEVASMIGKKTGVLGIADSGFAQKLLAHSVVEPLKS